MASMRLVLWVIVAFTLASVRAEDTVDFNRDIRPILSENCYTCHGPDDNSRVSTLRFDDETSAKAALPNGRFAIVPGAPGDSAMYARVASANPATRMPPAYAGHDPLSAEQIELVRRWIAEGAAWSTHWSFTRIERPAPPDAGSRWARNAIDRFIAHRLDVEGLAPSPEASAATLLRRVSLDLTGLPPTPEDVAAFVANPSDEAYARHIERLLVSPRYGEHMATPWLDAARYADSNGYQNDKPRFMWRWRDWVINAFNENKPYDEFLVEQIAGDLLRNPTIDQLVATGFNRNHRGNAENGADPREYHVEYVVDRVETTSTVFLGLTMGCARCHDHKYDPLSQKEFYQFYAYFNQVADRGRYFKYGNTPPLVKAPTEEQMALLAGIDARLEHARGELAREERAAREDLRHGMMPDDGKWIYDRRLRFRASFDPPNGVFEGSQPTFANLGQNSAAVFDGQTYFDAGDVADFGYYDAFTLSAWIKPEAVTGGIIARVTPGNALPDTAKGYGLYLIDGRIHMRVETSSISDRMRVRTRAPIEIGRETHVAGTYDGTRTTNGFHIYVDGIEQPLEVLIDDSLNATRTSAPLRIGYGPAADDRFRGAIADARVYDRALSQDEVDVISYGWPLLSIAVDYQHDRASDASLPKLRAAWRDRYGPEPLRRAHHTVSRLELARERLLGSFPTVMVMRDLPEGRTTHRLNRGAFDAPAEAVIAGVPAALPRLPDDAPNDRLGLARWMISRDHPLTARVAVNRLWQQIFGRGIVATSEDFGAQGSPPTHPELLDWLAAEYMDSGWDTKALLKTIVTSATYRQESRIRPELREHDPENLLLARAPRVRLAAQAIRDQALAVSGLLTDKIGGPSVRPYQPDGLWKELANAETYTHDMDEDLYRRSLYTYWKRTIAPPSMLTFDAAGRETCVVRQPRTNTPLQALNLMNDPTYVEAARALAIRMLDSRASPDDRLDYGFLLATARRPTDSERRILSEALSLAHSRYSASPKEADAFLRVGEYGSSWPDKAELAAYATAASLILNLDETITKE